MEDLLFFTNSAIKKLKSIELQGEMLHITVVGGGCGGFQYVLDTTKDESVDDIKVIKNDIKALVSKSAIAFLKGSTVDYKKDLMGEAFVINNPMADFSCGCGSSFDIK